jgi:UDP-4-amino-4,6-dideoxy-N-acetyl-beta-L-altrosamine N-acetyltransferase
MLVIEQYGVKLKRLTIEDTELVRRWRNQSEVANYMEYRNYITPEAQKEWFKTINNKFNYYFIIEFEGKKVGVINAKNYSPELGFGEGGIFIGDKKYIHSFAAVFATLCLLNFFLITLKLCEKSRARILRTNKKAIHYNRLIGYKMLPNQENVYNQLYELTLEDYLIHGAKLNKAAAILNNDDARLTYSGTICEENGEEINQLLAKGL